ncbi:hypothetical protein Ssi02_33010 [Sinosporangium siamense]|uniref:Uncharacterized protein n=1 Tax=Sinosporangium siamense TaxID=1367973 RepID=A0A919RFQ7_9ACTN|nr:hypothetical protein Ssi02_33010 [Sinosporangium siamense]
MRERSEVPLWLPWPLPADWMISGFAEVANEQGAARASVVALSGPSVTYGPGDLLVVAEEPGVGLGAAYAGLSGPDPGPGFGQGTTHAKVHAMGHPVALWWVESAADRAVYAGEALGNWLWMVAWPADAGCLIALGQLSLLDLRDNGHEFDLPFGALTTRLETDGT